MGTTGSFGTGTVAITSGAFVDFNRSNAYVCANVISGAGKVRNIGIGYLSLTGANSYTGGTDLNSGTIGFNSGSLGPSGNITFNASATLRWEPGNTSDISSRLVFSAGVPTFDVANNTVSLATAFSNAILIIVKDGTGRLTIASSNNVIDAITVKGGELKIGAGASIGTWDGDITVEAGATVIFDHSNDVVITQQISGAGQIIKRGSGKLTLSNGGNNFTGATTVEAGHLALNMTGSSDVTVKSGATFSAYQLGATITIGDLNIESGGILKVAMDTAGPTIDTINCDIVTLTTGAILTLVGYQQTFAPGITSDIINYSGFSGSFSNAADGSTINTGNISPYAPYILVTYDNGSDNFNLLWFI